MLAPYQQYPSYSVPKPTYWSMPNTTDLYQNPGGGQSSAWQPDYSQSYSANTPFAQPFSDPRYTYYPPTEPASYTPLPVPTYEPVPPGFTYNNLINAPVQQTHISMNRPPLAEPREVKASHILVKTKEQALQIKQQLARGASFEQLAAQFSKCPSGKEGGDLGFFKHGQMVPEFDKVAFKLPPGVISDPIKTDFGYHLIKVTDQKF